MTTVFLDLEKTLIHSWEDPVLINENIIRKKLDLLNPDTIGIYSFAIYDDKDRTVFTNSIKQEIESSLHIKIESSFVFTVSEIAETVLNKKSPDIQSFIQEYGKQKSFEQFIHQKFQSGNFTLIDELVENLDLYENQILSIHFLNPFLKISAKSKEKK